MKLNKFEYLLMNNPFRAGIQEKFEFPMLIRMLASRRLDNVLEIGCGNGGATRLIWQHLRPKRIAAVDLDVRMIRIAKQRNLNDRISFQVMDTTALGFPDQVFDAVFDFGSMHHVPNWRDAVGELKRVLAPGGELIMEDLSIESFSGFPGRAYRPLMVHPYAQMYTVSAFVNHVKDCGFTVTHLRQTNPLGLVKFFYLAARA